MAEKGEIANSDISRDVEQNMKILEVFEGVYGRVCHTFWHTCTRTEQI